MSQNNNFFNNNPFSKPCEMAINGHLYKVRTNFKDWIKVILLYGDKTIPNDLKIEMLLKLAFIDEIKEYDGEFIKAINSFLNCGEEIKEEKERNKLYDFKQDWDYIYSAFMQQYKIDLNESKMHWFDFIKLFKGLSNETEFVKIIGYRGVNLNEIKDKDQKKYYRKLKERYALEDEYKTEDCLFDESILESFKR